MTLVKAAVIKIVEKVTNKCKSKQVNTKINPRKCICCWGSRKFRHYNATNGCCKAWSTFFHNLAVNFSYMNFVLHIVTLGKVTIIFVDIASDIIYISQGPFYRSGL